MSVLDGTQSVSTHAPPRPSRSTTVTCGTELRGDQGGLVAAGAAADNHDPRLRLAHDAPFFPAGSDAHRPGPPAQPGLQPASAATCPRRAAPGSVRLGTVAIYAAYASNMDPAQMAERCPHSPQRGSGWLEGWRLTFGGEDLGWEGALATVVEAEAERVFVVLYDITGPTRAPWTAGTASPRLLPQAQGPGGHPRRRRRWPGCTCSTPTKAACPQRGTWPPWPTRPRWPAPPMTTSPTSAAAPARRWPRTPSPAAGTRRSARAARPGSSPCAAMCSAMRPVPPQVVPAGAEPEHPVRHVAQRLRHRRHEVPARYGSARTTSAPRQRRRAARRVERPHRRRVQHGHVQPGWRPDRVAQRPDRDDRARPAGPQLVSGPAVQRTALACRDSRRYTRPAGGPRAAASASSGWPGTCTVQPGSVSSSATSPGEVGQPEAG